MVDILKQLVPGSDPKIYIFCTVVSVSESSLLVETTSGLQVTVIDSGRYDVGDQLILSTQDGNYFVVLKTDDAYPAAVNFVVDPDAG